MIVNDRFKNWITAQLGFLKQLDTARENKLGHAPDYLFFDHSHRVANNMRTLALKMDKGGYGAEALYWATLAHDIGKASDEFDVEIWDYEEVDTYGNALKPPEDMKRTRRAHTTYGVDMVKATFPEEWNSDPFLCMVCDMMQNHHDYLNGSGYLKKTADDLSEEVQMLTVCDSYDGWTIPRPHKTSQDLNPTHIIENKMGDGRFNLTILKLFQEINICQLKPSL